jgi:hypothetical protein
MTAIAAPVAAAVALLIGMNMDNEVDAITGQEK